MELSPPVLKDLVSAGQCIAYVGAGFSMPCGMPSWSALLVDLADYVEQNHSKDYSIENSLNDARLFISGGDLVVAASILKSLLSKSELNRQVARQFSLSRLHESDSLTKKIMQERFAGLIGSNFSGIITTNYDTLIEYGLSLDARRSYKQSTIEDDQLGDVLCRSEFNQRFFVKLHGSITNGGYVLSTEEYGRVYIRRPSTKVFLLAAMLQYHFVFLGCSLEDEVLGLRREACETFSGNLPLAYALLPDNKRNHSRAKWLFDNCLIQTLFYVPKETGRKLHRHHGVEVFLNELKASDDPAYLEIVSAPAVSYSTETSDQKDKMLLSIGTMNRSILRFITSRGGIQHSELLYGTTRDLMPIGVRSISHAELFYRIQFLISSGMILEKVEVDGRLKYFGKT